MHPCLLHAFRMLRQLNAIFICEINLIFIKIKFTQTLSNREKIIWYVLRFRIFELIFFFICIWCGGSWFILRPRGGRIEREEIIAILLLDLDSLSPTRMYSQSSTVGSAAQPPISAHRMIGFLNFFLLDFLVPWFRLRILSEIRNYWGVHIWCDILLALNNKFAVCRWSFFEFLRRKNLFFEWGLIGNLFFCFIDLSFDDHMVQQRFKIAIADITLDHIGETNKVFLIGVIS